ncbi:MAG: hypothetical protein HY060_22265 [Proteobacteria bacterium]|nr:hypothetical protein [Pseudomonadota bacterium]
MVKPISPYLQRPLRSLDEALRDLERERAQADAEAGAKPPQSPARTPETSGKSNNPKDLVTIAGQPVAIEPAEPTAASTGSTLDVKA